MAPAYCHGSEDSRGKKHRMNSYPKLLVALRWNIQSEEEKEKEEDIFSLYMVELPISKYKSCDLSSVLSPTLTEFTSLSSLLARQ